MNKLDVQNAILNAMTPYLDDDQLYQLKNTLIEQLYGMNIVEEETRLSVGKRTKICVKKNENLCQKFCAATAIIADPGTAVAAGFDFGREKEKTPGCDDGTVLPGQCSGT